MPFQIILTLMLGVLFTYALALGRRALTVSRSAMLTTAAALYFVWRPEDANKVAAAVGIGRGADLILYCWTLISLLLILNLHVKQRNQNETMTRLVRELALRHPVVPDEEKRT